MADAIINADHIVTQRFYVLRAIGFKPLFSLVKGGFGDLKDAQIFTENEATDEKGYGSEWVPLKEAQKEVEDYNKKHTYPRKREPGEARVPSRWEKE